MENSIITVENLVKDYGNFRAVDHISFTVERGQTVAILGPNGAGKTTTLTMLLGLLTPTAGKIEILGKNMLTQRYDILPELNFSSPYVDLPGTLTVYENLNVYAHLYSIPERKKRIETLAENLSITNLLKQRYGTLSAGQKTRVSIAKALLNKPKILLLDEPTASLDPDTADWVRGYLEKLQQDYAITILLASHNMNEVERLCHKVLMMKDGKIVGRGAPKELIASYGRQNMEEVFLHIARNPIEAA